MKKNFLIIISFAVAMLAVFACAKKPTQSAEKIYMQKMYNELKNALPDNTAEVSIIEDSVKVIFKNGILFSIGQSRILDEMKPNFERFANVLVKYSNTNIIITGHTDNTGDRTENKLLSEKRAQSAWQMLVDYNVNGNRMTSLGQGEMVPIASNSTAEGRAKNRRIEFIILYNSTR